MAREKPLFEVLNELTFFIFLLLLLLLLHFLLLLAYFLLSYFPFASCNFVAMLHIHFHFYPNETFCKENFLVIGLAGIFCISHS